jgi:hypothetical protein
MGRKPRLAPSGRNKSQLNATIPEQLLLDFNTYCHETRTDEARDGVLEEALKWYLSRRRKAPKRAATHAPGPEHQECEAVIASANEYAAKIVEITSSARGRRRKKLA